MVGAAVQENLDQDVESIVDEDILEAPAEEKTAKEMGSNLEDVMEKILSNRGFTTKTRIKLRGASGQFNEIDVMAKRGKQTIAVECKNYAESAKIGIEAMRDFSSKLDDLGISEGLFVTSSDFSQDAIGWAQNNPRSKKIRLWNGTDLSKNFQSMVLGRKVGDMKKFNDCLKPRDTIESYSEILLQNKDRIVISRRELVFNPYYIVQFTIRDQCKIPDRQIYTIHDTGTYFVDGFTGDILYRSSDKGDETFVEEDEQRQISEDLNDIESYKTVEVVEAPGSEITAPEPGKSRKDVEFGVRQNIIEENTQNIKYTVRGRRDENDKEKKYKYVPSLNTVQLHSKVIRVPRLRIEFSSKEYIYSRVILPASDTTLVDEIAECKHILKKRQTFAVCDVCGIAKCQKDIVVDDSGAYFCKKHAPGEAVESKKKGSIRSRFFYK
ncbi:MAG: restriction endonuclease [Nitrosopumilus sp. D6]|nr:MAG: restriction endonuclease [Nitrosopumilus sp. D6]